MTDTSVPSPKPDSFEAEASPQASSTPVAFLLRWVFVVAVCGVLAGCLFVTSLPGPPPALVEAVLDGQAPRGLLPAIELMALSYRWPTPRGIEIKFTVLALGVTTLAVLAALAWCLLGGSRAARGGRNSPDVEGGQAGPPPTPFVRLLAGLDFVAVAQGLAVALVFWGLVSRAWASAPGSTVRAAGMLAVHIGWALLLARGLAVTGDPIRAVRRIVRGLVLLLFAATLFVLSLHGLPRWTVESYLPLAQGPVFSACVLPGLVLGLVWLLETVRGVGRGARSLGWVRWILCVVGLVPLVLLVLSLAFAMYVNASRAAWLGGLVGVVVLIALALRGKGRYVVLALGGVAILIACGRFAHFATTSGSLPAAELRMCTYTWRHALQACAENQGTGLGLGAFSLSNEDRMSTHAFDDPTVVLTRWAGHAQSEWLESLADVGLIGLHITVGIYLLTVLAALGVLRRTQSARDRWCLIGLLAALLGMIAEASTSSSLRFDPTPALWYTVLGCTWAVLLSARSRAGVFRPGVGVRLAGGGALIVLGLVAGWLGLRSLRGDRDLVLGERGLSSRDVAQALTRIDRAERYCLRPRYRAHAKLLRARARLTMGKRGALAAFEQARRMMEAQTTRPGDDGGPGDSAAGRPMDGVTTRPPSASGAALRALWQRPVFRGLWEDTRRQLEVCLRELDELTVMAPGWPRTASVEANACGVLADLWEFRSRMAGPPRSASSKQAARQAEQFRTRRLKALVRSLDRLPMNARGVEAFLQAAGDLPMANVVSLVRAPLRHPMIRREYHGLLLRVAGGEGFRQTFQPLAKRARQDAKSAPRADWSDPLAPETLRFEALVRAAQGHSEQAIACADMAVALYSTKHATLSVQEARAQAQKGWYQLLVKPNDPQTATETMRKAVVVAERPRTDTTLQPIYRLIVYGLLAGLKEDSARSLSRLITDPDGRRVDPNSLLVSSYEMLARTFFVDDPERRPDNWGEWVTRAEAIAPEAAPVLSLAAIKAAEEGDAPRAASYLERAWQGANSRQEATACLSALRYVTDKYPENALLLRLRDKVMRQIGGTTQPATTTAPLPQGAPVPATAPAKPADE